MTDVVSRSTSSGATSACPRRRARAVSPSSPSSASAGAKTLASTTSTVLPQRLDHIGEWDRAACPPSRSSQDLVHGWGTRRVDEHPAQILLQRLAGPHGSLTQHGVRLFRDVLDLNAWHSVIMACPAPLCKLRLHCPRSGADPAGLHRRSRRPLSIKGSDTPQSSGGRHDSATAFCRVSLVVVVVAVDDDVDGAVHPVPPSWVIAARATGSSILSLLARWQMAAAVLVNAAHERSRPFVCSRPG